jgi:hypothetical protein
MNAWYILLSFTHALYTQPVGRLFANARADVSTRLSSHLRDAVTRAQKLDPVNRVSYLEARCYMRNTLLRDPTL